MREQDDWDAHAGFMDGLVDDGFLLLGGPIGDGMRFLHVIEAHSKRDVEARLAEDPWAPIDRLRTASIEPWEILLGGSLPVGSPLSRDAHGTEAG
jgi:uncharacterized protein YciI